MSYLPDKKRCLEEAYDALNKATHTAGMTDNDTKYRKMHTDIATGWMMLADRIGSDLPTAAREDAR